MASNTVNLATWGAKRIFDLGKSTSWIYGRNAARVKTTSYTGYDAVWSMKTSNGDWSAGVYTNNRLFWTYTPDDKYTTDSNTGYVQMVLNNSGHLTAVKFIGPLQGNADTATNADTVDNEHASAFAHIAAHNNLTASGNEFTTASSGFSGAYWWNYRTAGGTNGNITQYYFGNGKGGALASITDNTFNGNVSGGNSVWANGGPNGERNMGVDSATSGNLYFFAAPTGKGIFSNTGYQNGYVILITSTSTSFYGELHGKILTPNNTWNTIGDDVQIGDINEAGTLGIQGLNGHTSIRFTTYNQGTATTGGKIIWDGSQFVITASLHPYTTLTQHLGNGTNEWNSSSIRQIYTRHIDASLGYSNDYNIYYGYGRATEHFFYRGETGGGRLLLATINANGIYAHAGWLRTYNSTGWHNESYGGGWYMQDPTYVRCYNGKRIYTSNAERWAFQAEGGFASGSACPDIFNCAYGSNWYPILYNHQNANISVNACGGGLYIGYFNTNGQYFYTNGAQRGSINNNGIYGAVWNDFAEFRKSHYKEPGRVVIDLGNGYMDLCNKRLAAGAKIISDTYGMSVGYSLEQDTPIGVGGRVLAYPYQDKNKYHVGDCVCSAPGGTIDLMTREEIIQYPERILGTVSEIPTYEIWKQQASEDSKPVELKVKGRIWIYVR